MAKDGLNQTGHAANKRSALTTAQISRKVEKLNAGQLHHVVILWE